MEHRIAGQRTGGAIHIAAALIDDGSGRLLLVRKAGTQWFMQAGGKIEEGEDAPSALRRELSEEIGLTWGDGEPRYLGRYSAPAANEPDFIVVAEVYHVRSQHTPKTQAEIAEAVWVSYADATAMPLAPLTREHILPLLQKILSVLPKIDTYWSSHLSALSDREG